MSRGLRAPATDRTAVIIPAWEQVPQLVTANQQVFDATWRTRRAETQRALLSAACDYTAWLTGQSLRWTTTAPLIVGGHQPELFHPGVWAKNFAIGRLAEQCGGVSLHLVVDHDVLHRRGIDTLAGTLAAPLRAWEPFDAPSEPQPWEEARVRDPQVLQSFAERIERRQQSWGIRPLVHEAWPHALEMAQRDKSLVAVLTAARHAVEARWGIRNLELPVSRLCTTLPFLQFTAELIGRCAEVAEHYNAVVRAYRKSHRIRSHSHPVADLSVDQHEIELPLRIWLAGATQRQRLFAGRRGRVWVLRDEHQELCTTQEHHLVEALEDLQIRGYRLRPRALTLTLFARMWLADLFVHGLGGALYDEMTDALASRLYGMAPPPFLTISATVWLPLAGRQPLPVDLPARCGAIRQQLWRVRHNPQAFLEPTDPLVVEKTQLLREPPPAFRAARRQRYLRIREINRELSARLQPLREELLQTLSALEHQHLAERLLTHREFSWVLFPEETLRSFYETIFPRP